MENLPQAIQNPLAVFRSATHVGSFVVLTELKHGNRSYVAAIEANRQAGRLLVNSIRSVHYHTGLNIVNWINEKLGEYYRPDFIDTWLNPLKNELRSKPQYTSAEVRTQLNDAAKVTEKLETLAKEMEKIARALGAKRYGSGSQYATFETKKNPRPDKSTAKDSR